MDEVVVVFSYAFSSSSSFLTSVTGFCENSPARVFLEEFFRFTLEVRVEVVVRVITVLTSDFLEGLPIVWVGGR